MTNLDHIFGISFCRICNTFSLDRIIGMIQILFLQKKRFKSLHGIGFKVWPNCQGYPLDLRWSQPQDLGFDRIAKDNPSI